LIGNDRIKSLLRGAVAEGRLEQGLIMAGPRGVGKRQFAIALAQALNCEQPASGDACGACIPCQRIAAGEHPDVQTVQPDGQFIKINQMRQLRRESQYKTFEGRRRVLIVDEAEKMRQEAANSILKTLEEPPDASLIILLTSKPYALLETIRSRCQMLNFAPLQPAQIESYLAANYRRPIEEIRLLARLADGSIGRALEIDLGQYRQKRELVLELIESLISGDELRLMSAAEYLGRKLEREGFLEHMDALMLMLYDLFRLKLCESEESLVNIDMADRLAGLARAVNTNMVADWVERLEEILRNLNRNINRQLALERFFIACARSPRTSSGSL
jgi:DNA polymerase-3 subunit delta'